MNTAQNETLLSTFLVWLETIEHNPSARSIKTAGWNNVLQQTIPDYFREGKLTATINSIGYLFTNVEPGYDEYVCMDLTAVTSSYESTINSGGKFVIDVILYTGSFPATETRKRITSVKEWKEFLTQVETHHETPAVRLTQLIPITFRPTGILQTIMMAGLDNEGCVWGYVGEAVNGSNWIRIPFPSL